VIIRGAKVGCRCFAAIARTGEILTMDLCAKHRTRRRRAVYNRKLRGFAREMYRHPKVRAAREAADAAPSVRCSAQCPGVRMEAT